MNLTKLIIFLFKNKLYQNIALADKLQYESADEIASIQNKKFKKLIEHAKENVPYYSNVLDGIQEIEDISKISFLTKNDVRNNVDNLRATNFDKDRFMADSTSGSTGDSMPYFRDNQNNYRRAVTYRDDAWSGYEIGAKALSFWGAERDILNNKSLYVKIKDDYIHKLKKLSAYHLSDKDLNEYIKIYNSYKPKVVIAYPSTLYYIASYIEKNNIKIKYPKGIITSAETLFPFQREQIEKVFKCKIFNRYGSREFGHIASECEAHKGLHFHNDRFVLEIINEKGEACKPNELGEIVITDLDEYTFPLIRYKTGDLGKLSDENCSCGRGLSLLETIEGRVFDLIKGANGNLVGGTFWTLLRRKVNGFVKFQIIQDESGDVEIVAEKNNLMESDFEETIIKLAKEKLGDNANVKVSIIDKIPVTKTGKHRWIISKVSPFAKS